MMEKQNRGLRCLSDGRYFSGVEVVAPSVSGPDLFSSELPEAHLAIDAVIQLTPAQREIVIVK